MQGPVGVVRYVIVRSSSAMIGVGLVGKQRLSRVRHLASCSTRRGNYSVITWSQTKLWNEVKSLFPRERPKLDGNRSRESNRACLTAIVFVLKTGANRGDGQVDVFT